MDLRGRLGECRGQRLHQGFPLLDEVEDRAPGRARAQPRQAGEKLDQTLDLGGSHEAGGPAATTLLG